MPFSHFKGRSLKTFLMWRFLPLLILSVVAVTSWTIWSTWNSAWYSGTQWALNSSNRFIAEVGEIADEILIARTAAIYALEKNRLDLIPPKYVLFDLSGEEELAVVAGSFSIPESSRELVARFDKFKKPGLYELNGNLVYAMPFESAYRNGIRKVMLVRMLGQAFADRLARAIGSEVAILLIRPVNRVALTSWKNLKDKRVFPELSSRTWSELSHMEDDDVKHGKGTFQIPDYRGLYPDIEGEKAFNRGQSAFHAFYSYRPILDENRQRIGYFSVIIPEDILMRGVKRGIFLSLVCAVVVMLLAAWLILRVSGRVAAPLTLLADQVDQISGRIQSKYQKYGIPGSKDLGGAPGSEIERLQHGIGLLADEVSRADRIEALLNEERARALSASKMAALGEMSASVAHEINNPVSVIHALADEIQEKGPPGLIDQDTKEKAIIIKQTAMRVASIVRALLRISRAGDADPKEWHSLEGIANDALLLVSDQIRKHNISLTTVLPKEDVGIFCRDTQISQVILNLLNNAIDAVEPMTEKWIRLEVRKIKNKIQLEIADSGPGVPPQLRDKIMDPFVTNKAPGKGTGLGLSITKHILDEHMGQIYLDHNGPHTRFVIELPQDGIDSAQSLPEC